ncbi:DUF805 domain-containing protein [Nissabacter archeti]|uniref:DUF805 domain-containing protein n=1 Tax=Nissabacter archeti TaxID=1917880 RepID=UPI000932206F|nr:DUF805 domain-containing protein [Nissabacter archeti]
MTLQAWGFSFRGRLGRRDFWVWLVVWLVVMGAAFLAADRRWVEIQSAAFLIVFLLWPTSAVLVKRLHDRNRAGGWAFLLILAWVLAAGNWQMLPSTASWALGRLLPSVIFAMMLVECGFMPGTPDKNRFGPPAEPVHYRL